MSDAILSKVRKLLAKAEDPACPPAEAEACTAKATELIAKYGVDRARLAADDPAIDPVGDRMVEVPGPYARDKASLLAGVAGALRCRIVYVREGRWFAVHLFGCASDLARSELLFTSLLVQAAHGLAAAPVPPLEHPAAFRRTWLAGFTTVVIDRLRAAERRAATNAGGPSTALVLADRSAAVERRVAEVYPHRERMRPRRLHGGGLHSGMAAGRAADLGGSSVAGHRPDRALPA